MFTSSLGCETASGKALQLCIGLTWGREYIASWLGPGQQALAAWVKDQATDSDLKAEGSGARESVYVVSRVLPLRIPEELSLCVHGKYWLSSLPHLPFTSYLQWNPVEFGSDCRREPGDPCITF